MNEFYNKCAIILNVEYNGKSFQHRKRNRWNNREPGHGRFDNIGTIRHYGVSILIALRNPICHRIFKTEEEVFTFLRGVVNNEV